MVLSSPAKHSMGRRFEVEGLFKAELTECEKRGHLGVIQGTGGARVKGVGGPEQRDKEGLEGPARF